MRGRPPVPTAKKILEGNPGHRPLNDDEPEPRRESPTCPDWLDEEAKRVWAELLPEVERMGVITVVDGMSFSVLCQGWSEFKTATETLAREGRIVQTFVYRGVGENRVALPGGLIQHPAVNQQRTAMDVIRQYSQLFGLNPSSRCRIHVSKQEEADPLDEFIKPRIAKETGT